MRLRGTVALVTGASSGIGRASAVRLAAAGARVLAHGRDAARLTELAGKIGAVPLVADLASPDAGDRLAEAALAAAGRVDIVVNNAGIGWAGPLAGMAAGDVDRLVMVNLTAPIALTRALLPQMGERRTGYLMFVSSIAGRLGVAGESVYSATKGGLDVFAESLRLELAGTGVRVGVLVPGVVQTAFFERRGRPYQRERPRPMTAETVAGTLVAMIENDRADGYAPGWLRLPVAVRGVLPGVYRRLGARFGGSA
jgi:short-subunit dehydrogenase